MTRTGKVNSFTVQSFLLRINPFNTSKCQLTTVFTFYITLNKWIRDEILKGSSQVRYNIGSFFKYLHFLFHTWAPKFYAFRIILLFEDPSPSSNLRKYCTCNEIWYSFTKQVHKWTILSSYFNWIFSLWKKFYPQEMLKFFLKVL